MRDLEIELKPDTVSKNVVFPRGSSQPVEGGYRLQPTNYQPTNSRNTEYETRIIPATRFSPDNDYQTAPTYPPIYNYDPIFVITDIYNQNQVHQD